MQRKVVDSDAVHLEDGGLMSQRQLYIYVQAEVYKEGEGKPNKEIKEGG